VHGDVPKLLRRDCRSDAWFGEGAVLKKEPRRYDLVALRDARLAMTERATFLWLFENSVAFNRFLVEQLNERPANMNSV
jgi:CRP-like cAMP-binding protein